MSVQYNTLTIIRHYAQSFDLCVATPGRSFPLSLPGWNRWNELSLVVGLFSFFVRVLKGIVSRAAALVAPVERERREGGETSDRFGGTATHFFTCDKGNKV